MKIFEGVGSLKKKVEAIINNEASVDLTIPKPATTFVVIPPASPSLIKKEGFGEALLSLIESSDIWDIQIPTEMGNGVVLDLKNWLDSAWEVWGISPNQKFLLYKPGELHVFTLEQLAEYFCKTVGVEAVGYAYPENFRISFDVTTNESWEPSTQAGMAMKAIMTMTLGKEGLSASELDTLQALSSELNAEIWGDNDYFICPSGKEVSVYVIPKGFSEFMDNFDDIADVIIANLPDDDMSGFITTGVNQIRDVVHRQDIKVLMNLGLDVIDMLQAVVTDGPAVEGVKAMAKMLDN